jgi:ABC-type hemin transport system ATPase subunit
MPNPIIQPIQIIIVRPSSPNPVSHGRRHRLDLNTMVSQRKDQLKQTNNGVVGIPIQAINIRHQHNQMETLSRMLVNMLLQHRQFIRVDPRHAAEDVVG